MTKQSIWLIGTISCKAALEEEKRVCRQLLVNGKKRTRDIAYIISLAKRKNIPVVITDGETLLQYGKGNGGVVLECEATSCPSLSQIPNPQGLCVYISGVEDPYNLGSIARTLYAAGAELLVIPTRDWGESLPILIRSSAGAWERLTVAQIESEEELVHFCKEHALPVISAYRGEESKSLYETQLPRQLMLVIGGAMRGISSYVLQHSDETVHIPYGREFRNALDTPSATAVLAFGWMQQHMSRDTGQ